MNNLGVEIKEIKELSFISNLADYDESIEDTIEINHNIDISTSPINDAGVLENNEVAITHTIALNSTIKENRPKNNEDLLVLKARCLFKVDNLESFVESQENNLVTKLKSDLMYIILATSVGTVRGMLSYKTASLPINMVLPIIDVAKAVGKFE